MKDIRLWRVIIILYLQIIRDLLAVGHRSGLQVCLPNNKTSSGYDGQFYMIFSGDGDDNDEIRANGYNAYPQSIFLHGVSPIYLISSVYHNTAYAVFSGDGTDKAYDDNNTKYDSAAPSAVEPTGVSTNIDYHRQLIL